MIKMLRRNVLLLHSSSITMPERLMVPTGIPTAYVVSFLSDGASEVDLGISA